MDVISGKTECLIEETPKQYKLYKKRWLVLVAYCVLSFSCVPTATCFTAISNILQEYYHVAPIAIHMLLAVYGVAILVFNLPAAYVLHRFGLAATLKMAAVFNLIGGIVRYFSYIDKYGYYLLLTGNCFSALSLASYMFLPAKLAQSWFGENEKGTAIGVGIGFDMIATGIGFLHTTLLVHNDGNRQTIKEDLKLVVLQQLIAAVIAFFVIMFVPSKPKTPPSKQGEGGSIEASEIVTTEETSNEGTLLKGEYHPSVEENNNKKLLLKDSFWKSIKNLLRHRNFLVLIHISSITASLEISLEMILNDVLIKIFPGREREIGIVGFAAIVAAFASNTIAGVILDKTKAYLKMTRIIFIFASVSAIAWLLLIELYHSFVLIALSFCFLIMITTSFYAVGNTYIVIATYPIDPGTSTMISMMVQSFYLMIIATSSSVLLVYVNVLYVNLTILLTLLGALLLTLFIRPITEIQTEIKKIAYELENVGDTTII